MTDQALADIELSVLIDAPRARVWENMTQTDKVPQWLGCMQYEKRIGALFYMQQDADKRAAGSVEGATHCEVLELNEPEEFRFSWFLPGTPKTFVSLHLKETEDGKTRVDFVHSGWDQFSGQEIRSIRDALLGGWDSFVLPNLKRISEGT